MAGRGYEKAGLVARPFGEEGAFHNAKSNLMLKVLDFIQFGGPDLTIDSTVFEMWMEM